MEEADVKIEELDEIIDWWEEDLDANGRVVFASPELTKKFSNAGWERGYGPMMVKLTGDLSKYATPNRHKAWFAKSDNNGTCFLGLVEKRKNDSGYNIPAKEVWYKGVKFRSKLEARWAVAWDFMNLKWQYEPERFQTPNGGSYLPDFYLPEWKSYVEIKPGDEQLFNSAERISAAIDHNCTPVARRLLLLGEIPYSPTMKTGCFFFGNYLYWDEDMELIGDQTFVIMSALDQNPPHKYLGTEFGYGLSFNGARAVGYAQYPEIPATSSVNLHLEDGNWGDSFHPTALNDALKYARSARFDFDDSREKMIMEGRGIIGALSEKY